MPSTTPKTEKEKTERTEKKGFARDGESTRFYKHILCSLNRDQYLSALHGWLAIVSKLLTGENNFLLTGESVVQIEKRERKSRGRTRRVESQAKTIGVRQREIWGKTKK